MLSFSVTVLACVIEIVSLIAGAAIVIVVGMIAVAWIRLSYFEIVKHFRAKQKAYDKENE